MAIKFVDRYSLKYLVGLKTKMYLEIRYSRTEKYKRLDILDKRHAFLLSISDKYKLNLHLEGR